MMKLNSRHVITNKPQILWFTQNFQNKGKQQQKKQKLSIEIILRESFTNL